MLTKPRIHHVPAGEGPCIPWAGEMRVKVGAAQSPELTMIENVLIAPGSGPGLHIHEKENECYYVLDGEFEFVCGDDRVSGGSGTFVFAPRGLPHRFKNIGTAPGRLLVSFTPSGIEEFFAELSRQTELKPPIMMEIAARYGITLVAPPQ